MDSSPPWRGSTSAAMIPDFDPVTIPTFHEVSLNHLSSSCGSVVEFLVPFETRCPTGCLAGEVQLLRPQEQTDPSLFGTG
jgi:hypothetical protein